MQCAIYGNFSAPKAQEVMVSRGKVLELLRPDEGGKMQTILATEVFGAIRSLIPFRLTGGSRDYVIIGSESGRIVIVEYSKEKNLFVKVCPHNQRPIVSNKLQNPVVWNGFCNKGYEVRAVYK